jgi:Ras-related protein Rab-6A
MNKSYSAVDIISYKVCVFGNANVGKTSILHYLKYGKPLENSAPTIGASFISHKRSLPSGKILSLEIWDTAGHPRFHNLIPMYIRNSYVIILVYDMSDAQSLEETVKFWLPYFTENEALYPSDAIKYLVGNKIDKLTDTDVLTREIIKGERMAANYDCTFKNVSALTGDNIQDLFNEILQELEKKEIVPEQDKDVVKIKPFKNKNCCY